MYRSLQEGQRHLRPSGGGVVLRKVAQVVRDCVRKIDLAARCGGEEFAVVVLD